MTNLKAFLTASAAALTLAACATTDGDVLSAEQQFGVGDDQYAARSTDGMTTKTADMGDKFRVGCDDDDQFEARGCDNIDSDGDGVDRDIYADDTERFAFYDQYGIAYDRNSTVLGASTDNVVELIASSPDHTRLLNAIKGADLGDTLMEMGPYTIFAPTDAAFDNAALAGLSDDQDLKMLLMNHVVPGRYLAADVLEVIPASGSYNVPTLGDRTVDVYRSGDGFKILGADSILIPVLTADMIGSNGVVHVIDTVLVPDFDTPDIDPS